MHAIPRVTASRLILLPAVRRRHGARAFVLLAVLMFVLLFSVMVVSFMATMQQDRASSQNFSRSIAAQEIAWGGLQEVLGDLGKEIDAGSREDGKPTGASYTVSGVRIYVPVTNYTAMPARIGFPAVTFSPVLSSTKLPTSLLRVSRATDTFYSAPPSYYTAAKLPANRASAVPTTAPSTDGRTFSASRWNKPMLMGTTLPTPFANAPPDWVYVTRSGSRTFKTADIPQLHISRGLGQTNQVLGRYAYVMYDTSALLDLNVVGYTAAASSATGGPATLGGKTYTAYADLTQLPGLTNKQSAVDKMVKWRSKGAMASSPTYFAAMQSYAANGFMALKTGDNPLLGRQDLLHYFDQLKADGDIADLSALSYFTTFSRALTGPTWSPGVKAPNVDYGDLAEKAASENRDLANVRATDGKPLLKKRFPLNRIALLSSPVANSALIKDYFGLNWDATKSRFIYNHGDASNIKTLDEVRAAGREPDFFELLKAAMLNGSLGMDPGFVNYPYGEVWGQSVNGPAGMFFDTYSGVSDTNIIQIGANIIDQYDTDSLPTAIYFNAVSSNPDATSQNLSDLFNTSFGVENLPYLFSLRLLSVRVPTTPGFGQHYAWLQPALWNPHQTPPTGYTGTRPAYFRVQAYGKSEVRDWSSGTMTPATKTWAPTPMAGDTGIQYITFSDSGGASSPFYRQPAYLAGPATKGAAHSAYALNKWQSTYGTGVGEFVAFFCGAFIPPTTTPAGVSLIVGANNPRTCTFVTEYSMDNSTWLPYGVMSRYNAYCGGGSNVSTSVTVQGNFDLTRPDPRTDRFSTSMSWSTLALESKSQTYWPANGTIYTTNYFTPSTTKGFITPNSPGMFCINQNTGAAGNSCYADPDGVVRPGDGYRGVSTSGEGRPSYTSGETHGRRPVVLNRPFRSVGELGYVFRDLPFKTLDFWSKDSADAALLDVFCLEDEPELVAGQVNPSNAPTQVLVALLSGAAKKELDPTLVMNAADTTAVATAVSSYLQTNGPLLNRADLVTARNGTANLSQSINTALPAASDKANKAFGEAPVRALGTVSNTRTWNLMIDIIAQSGRISPGAVTLADFTVEGERRYWLHIAIDRYTGKVVDQQLEPVYE